MKTTLRFFLVSLVLGALTAGWLYLYTNSSAINTERQKYILDLLKELKQLDSEWNTDVLKSQMEIIRSYDALTRPLLRFEEILGVLDAETKQLGDEGLHKKVDSIRNALSEKAALIERFKSQNSLLKNSLRYAPTAYEALQKQTLPASLQKSATEKTAGPSMRPGAYLENKSGRILGDVFHYNFIPDIEMARRVEADIEKVREAALSYPGLVQESVNNLMTHLEAILRLRRQQSDLLKAIAAVPVASTIDVFNNAVTTRFNAQLNQQFTYQRYLLIYSAISLLLVFGFTGVTAYRNGTERKRLAMLVNEQTSALQSSAAQFAAMDEASPVGTFVTDANGLCVHVNPMFQAITGYSPEFVARMPWSTGIHPDDRERVLKQWSDAMRDDGGFAAECRFLRDDASVIWLSYKAAAMRSEGRLLGYAGTLEDISGRKNIERMKNEFIATVSHELRTPLTSIMGSLGLLAGGLGGALSAEGKALMDIAHKNSERLVRLITNILDIEKIESGSMHFDLRPLELQVLVEQAVAANHAYAAQFDASFVVTTRLPGVKALVDADRLIQVITNLMANAAKFSPRGGVVEIGLTWRDGLIRVSVADQGSGIPESFRDRIFRKFSQADSSDTRQKGGTGLGLSISKAIIETMNGAIGFAPREGGGTIFYFDLPEWREPAAPARARLAMVRPSILVCEDDKDVNALLCMMLDHAGYDTAPAYNAASARSLLAEGKFVAMTLDIGLPDLDGREFLRELRATSSCMPVVIVSANLRASLPDSNVDALDAVDWINKPIDKDRLINAIRRGTQIAPSGKSRVLHIEDDSDIRHVVASLCTEFADFESAGGFQEGAALLTDRNYDLIILDIELPDGSGWDLMPLIDKLAPRPQVLVFSGTELSPAESGRVAAALVKSHVSNPELLRVIQTLSGGS
ncbi:MAG TPA: DAHL domain-containing protein [Burkholderiales bacterium]|nr:DAHL domain-containing protein [Burkholderiales bacterium]